MRVRGIKSGFDFVNLVRNTGSLLSSCILAASLVSAARRVPGVGHSTYHRRRRHRVARSRMSLPGIVAPKRLING